MHAHHFVGWSALLLFSMAAAHAQQSPPGVPVPPLGAGPWVIDTAEQHKIRLSVVSRGLSHPWAIAFLPNGDMLVTERPGRLRLVRNGVLDPQPIAGVPTVRTDGNGGLMDVALHPQFATNRLVYLTYTKPVGNGMGAPSLARGRLEGHALVDVQDLLVPDAYAGNSGLNGRVAFGPDGKVYFSTGGRSENDVANVAQDMKSLRGKVLRLNDDGTVPADNPFVGREGVRPEIFTRGHRNTLGLIAHPVTGQMWQHENGPNGGDELNILKPGGDYGWPVVSYGRDYSGKPISAHPTREGIEAPLVYWVPAIAVAGMTVYTGDRFPAWKGNVLVGGLMEGRIPGTGHLQRVVFNERGEEIRRESMLREFRQRIREVRQGPDGLLYLLTDEDDGALLRIEPAPAGGAPAKSCEPRHGVRFICGPHNAEDLVQLPGTPWVIASGHAENASFFLVDSRDGAWRSLAFQARPDPAFARCATPPVPATFQSHGLDVLAQRDGRVRLHVVGHGAREAIEIFDVETRADGPALTWRGCLPMPEGYVGNSVASAPDGSLVATILMLPGRTFADSFLRKPTGIVLAWSPGEPGFTPLAGTELPANNGIEVSADGREIYVASSGLHSIVAFSRTNPARKLRSSRALPFTPDNVHLGPDGLLYTAGMANDVPACGGTPGPQHDLAMLTACPRGTIAAALDPRTLSDRIVLETPVLEGFSNATMLLPVGESFFVGSFSSDRIATGRLPKP